MLKSVFIGSKNEFDEIIVDWLSQHTELAGVVWSDSAIWRKTWKGRFNYGIKRAKKYGFLKVINELLLFFYVKRKIAVKGLGYLKRELIRPYWKERGRKFTDLKFKSISSDNVNKKEVLDFLNEVKPDIIFAMCVNDFFGKKIRSIPAYGVFLWHEGLTPEYKGLYSPFWTLYNGEYEKLAYTFLRMNDEIDGGEIFVQGYAKDIDLSKHNYSFIGHKAIFDSLPEVGEFLIKLESGSVKRLDRSDSKQGYYTYPGLTQYLKMEKRLKKYLKSKKR
ncbi:MAG: Bifunctional polymyxin resistance protein ArnA [Ignavibacteria bacterium]|nr:Bifunctional polymyxin resistance protein ArnA [Ignavibacteria bacterium]